MTHSAVLEYEKVQQGQPSDYWTSRIHQLDLIESWDELALLTLVSAWSGEPLPNKTSVAWTVLFNKMKAWPLHEDTNLVVDSMRSLHDNVLWSKEKAVALLRSLYQQGFKGWPSLFSFSDVKSGSLGYHTLYFMYANRAELLKDPENLNALLHVFCTAPLSKSFRETLFLGILNSDGDIQAAALTYLKKDMVQWANPVKKESTVITISYDFLKQTLFSEGINTLLKPESIEIKYLVHLFPERAAWFQQQMEVYSLLSSDADNTGMPLQVLLNTWSSNSELEKLDDAASIFEISLNSLSF